MEYRQILRQYWGYPDFRGIQEDIIRSIIDGRDTLGLMPTGGGKSITFQVPALTMNGVCIVVTPLIALMKDQVDHLAERGIRAGAIYSGMTRQEIIKTLENEVFGVLKLFWLCADKTKNARGAYSPGVIRPPLLLCSQRSRCRQNAPLTAMSAVA